MPIIKLPKLTLVMAYYENGGMLDKHLEVFESFPRLYKDRLKVIIVDDGSQDDPASKHMRDVGISIRLFRALVDIPWHQNGARNLGMHHADDGWCLMTDIDHLLTFENFRAILRTRFKPGYAYKPQRMLVDGSEYHQHPNTYLLQKELFWRVGGYNEEFCGYYGTDSTFRVKLAITGLIKDTDSFWLTLYKRTDIEDASTRRYGRKGSEYHISNNPELAAKRKDVYALIRDPGKVLNFEWDEVKLFEGGAS